MLFQPKALMEMKPHHLSGMKATGSIRLRFEKNRETLYWFITQCVNTVFCKLCKSWKCEMPWSRNMLALTRWKVKGKNYSDHWEKFHRLQYFFWNGLQSLHTDSYRAGMLGSMGRERSLVRKLFTVNSYSHVSFLWEQGSTYMDPTTPPLVLHPSFYHFAADTWKSLELSFCWDKHWDLQLRTQLFLTMA